MNEFIHFIKKAWNWICDVDDQILFFILDLVTADFSYLGLIIWLGLFLGLLGGVLF